MRLPLPDHEYVARLQKARLSAEKMLRRPAADDHQLGKILVTVDEHRTLMRAELNKKGEIPVLRELAEL